MPPSRNRLENLAQELTGILGIAFRATPNGVAFATPLGLAEWSVPLVFDGHLAARGGSLVPVDFVGHVLWAALRRIKDTDEDRTWWSCELSAFGAEAIIEDRDGFDETLGFDEELDEYPDWPSGHASGM